ncbi:MAG: hypothetical protein CM15mV91_340 [uncultured marine virus]|nr:MAG: hypothetical protein CM15mV91_340 [uncultured marine virus]
MSQGFPKSTDCCYARLSKSIKKFTTSWTNNESTRSGAGQFGAADPQALARLLALW